MLRYRLDDLGAFQFEWLVQSLGKIIIGPGVESWGGRGDYGRDLFSAGPLNFPDRSTSSPGPFIFQVKFIENANAAGAKPVDALKSAVRKEKARFLHRIKLGIWKHPKHYVLITNALLTPEFRRWAESSLGEILGDADYHFLSGSDVCDFLDQEPSIRRSFPQILGLRDLSELIQGVLNKIEKSLMAIECASEIAPVFVPTRAYNKAWRVLSDHNFVVLEGPAEMGKSAIAWMIALAQASNGWQAIYCIDPDTFFAQYDSSRQQVFIADDAFGLTEYDPTRSQKWEKELALVTRRLDAKHWLLWTSRKHILERALQKLDFKRASPDFPEPSAGMINAADLTGAEKALILYRHAKGVSLPSHLRDLIRKKAHGIIGDPNFTPERIRKLVKEVLPRHRASEAVGEANLENLNKEIREVIANPTERSKTTFRALPAGHKWALIAMLELGGVADLKKTAESYGRLCPEKDQEPFGDVLDQLTEAFVKRTRVPHALDEPSTEILAWIHPSYRDLVIDELARETSLSNRFLSHSALPGIRLAISSGGGRLGERELPFLTSDRAWQLLADRCRSLSAAGDLSDLRDFLETLWSAIADVRRPDEKRYLQDMVKDICEIARKRWDETKAILDVEELEAYHKASSLVSPLPPVPNLQPTWDDASAKFLSEIKTSKQDGYFFPDYVESFLKLVKVVQKLEPRFLLQNDFGEKYKAHFVEIFDLVESELGGQLSTELEDLRTDIYQLKSLRDLTRTAVEIMPQFTRDKRGLVRKLGDKITDAQSAAEELEPDEPDFDKETVSPSDETIDVELLFSDL